MARDLLTGPESRLRGGADCWDNGPAGVLLSAEFFGTAAPVDPVTVTPGTAGVSCGALAPSIVVNVLVTPGTAGITCGATAPTLVLPNNAVRFDAVGDPPRLATLPSAVQPVTVLGWVKLAVDRNNYSALFSYEGPGAATYNELITDADGTTLVLYDHTTLRATLGTMVAGTWHKAAMVLGSGTADVYFGTAGTPGCTKQTVTCSNIASVNALRIGTTAVDEWFNGAMQGTRAWNALLTQAEVEAEFTSATAVRTANLLGGWFPPDVTAGTALVAASGTNLTGSGTYTVEAGPTLDSGGGGITVIPGTASATCGAVAPTLASSLAVSTASVTAGARAPVLASSVAPATASVTCAALAPTLSLSGTVAPGVASVTAAALAPSIAAGILPAVAGVTAGALAPQLAASIAVGTAGVTCSAVAPVLRVPVAPGVASVTTAALAPALAASGVVTPATAGVTCAALAPSLAAGVSAGTASVTAGALAPSLSSGGVLGVASVVCGALPPTLAASVPVGTASATCTAVAPTLGVVVLPGVAGVTSSSLSPSLLSGTVLGTASVTCGALAPGLAAGLLLGAASITCSARAPGLAVALAPGTASCTAGAWPPFLLIFGAPGTGIAGPVLVLGNGLTAVLVTTPQGRTSAAALSAATGVTLTGDGSTDALVG